MTKYLLSHSDQFYFYYSFCLREEKVLNRLVISNNMSQFSLGSSRCKHSIYFLKISSGERTVSGLGGGGSADDEVFGSNRLLAKLFPAPKPNPLTMESTNPDPTIEGLDAGTGLGLGTEGLGLGLGLGSSLVVEDFKLRGILYIYLLFCFLNSF
jgi:hypothetical protein